MVALNLHIFSSNVIEICGPVKVHLHEESDNTMKQI